MRGYLQSKFLVLLLQEIVDVSRGKRLERRETTLVFMLINHPLLEESFI